MAQVRKLAASLKGKYGVKQGDRVAIAMRNFPEWCIAFMAATWIGEEPRARDRTLSAV